jgi:fructosamine-3-kinase
VDGAARATDRCPNLGRLATVSHPLLNAAVVRAVERAASAHRGRPWVSTGFTSLNDRAAHPAGIYQGAPFSVFAKLGSGQDGHAQFTAELSGLDLIRRLSAARTAVPVGPGVLRIDSSSLFLAEALPERLAGERCQADYEALAQTLAALHAVRGNRFGLAGLDGSFGPFRQDNQPVLASSWAAFYAERRLEPSLRAAARSGHLPADAATGVGRIIDRMPALAGPEPAPALLHGDAQQNNFIATAEGAVVIDACPYFGNPELDLALLGYFDPVPVAVFDAYRAAQPLDRDFEDRIELWRLFAYLAVIAVTGSSSLGRDFVVKVNRAVARYA